MDPHIDSETLAAFIDGTLPSPDRARVEAHLADCDACYEVWNDSRSVSLKVSSVQPVGSRRSVVTFAAVAASVALVLAGWYVAKSPGSYEATIAEIASASPHMRTTESRPVRGLPWSAAPTVVRGATPDIPISLQQAATAAIAKAEQHETIEGLLLSALGYLSLRRSEEAIAVLERAGTLAPDNGAVHMALGAAWLERHRLTGVAAFAGAALEQTQKAIAFQGPTEETLFNRALALAALGRTEDAISAWKDYLTLDPSSEWATEARERILALEQQRGGGELTTMDEALQRGLNALADQAPWLLLDLLDNRLLPAWLTSVEKHESADLDDIVRVSEALAARGRERFPLALFGALSTRPAPAQRAAAAALRQLSRARASFDQSDYPAAEVAATAAAASLRGLALPSHEADVFAAFSRFFRQEQAAGVAMADAVAARTSTQGFFRIQGRAAYLRGLHYSGLSDFSNAVAHLNDALRSFEAAGDRGQVAATHSQLLGVLSDAGMTERAWSHCVWSSQHLYPGMRERLRYLVLSNAQFFLIQSELFFSASTLSVPLQRLADTSGTPALAADVALVQAGLWQQLDNPDAVRATAATARRHVAALSAPDARRAYETALRLVEGRAFARAAPIEAIAALEKVVEDLSRTDRLIALAEARLWLGRARLASGDREAAEREWLQGVTDRNAERRVETDARIAARRTDKLWDLHGELIRLHRRSGPKSLLALERARMPQHGDREDASVPWASLPTDVAVLAYALLDGELAVWTVTHAGPEVTFRALQESDLEEQVHRLRTEAQAVGASVDTTQLSRLLLPSGSLPPGVRRLAVLADGPVHLVPFDLLVDPSGVRLGTRLQITRISSVAEATSTVQPASADQLLPLLIGYGAPQPEYGLHALPAVGQEIRALEQLYSGRGKSLLDRAASIPKVTSLLTSFNLIHVAGHAIPGSDTHAEPRIFLAPSGDHGVLTASAVSGLRLRKGTIVILSACSTAAGQPLRGEGLLGIAQPFLSAGASAVLASLWPVADTAAAATMLDVHRRLLNGATLQAAVAGSAQSLLNTSPAAWQPWVVIGPYSHAQPKGLP
jgi:CHAT domain-containing protein/tetratricopeptide (TPR) repeat protein